MAGVGQLTERELGKALVNGDFTSFDSHTVKMMIRMFDTDKDGKISFEEFWYVQLFHSRLSGHTDMSPAVFGVSLLPGAPSSIALMKTRAATYLLTSTRKRSLHLATAFLPLSLVYCTRPTIKVERIV